MKARCLQFRHWENAIPFFDYPEDIRKVIYTTNAIESLNRTLRKIIKNRGSFPTDESIYKLLYLALMKASKKWTLPIRNWNDDYTEITFALRKGHRWSDGEPFTTDDVVFFMNDIILNEDIHKATPSPMPAIGLPSCILATWLKWPPPKHSIIHPGIRILKRSCQRSHPMTPN
jgi:hypothetical protein